MNTTTKKYFISLLLGALCSTELLASLGSEIPEGPAGEPPGSGATATADSISPYTANARRTVTDLIVSGGVGAYPLAFSRVSNSRAFLVQDNSIGGGPNADLGTGGGWLRSYQWYLTCKWPGSGKPTKYTVNYPDGRGGTFTAATNGDPYWRGGLGVQDRLQLVWNTSTDGNGYLIMPDGGKVWFSISRSAGNTLRGIIDPYGQVTTISGTVQTGLITVTEPGGRWIKMHFYTPAAWTSLIDYVLASDGRRVDYSYIADWSTGVNWQLSQVTYYSDPNLVATYTYQPDNSNTGGNYLLSTAVDPMYGGAMWKIAYTYATATNPDGTLPVYGQIQSENYFDGTNAGAAVSTLTVQNTNTRIETRGDGKTRTFTYDANALLTSWTDFKGNSASQTFDTNRYANSSTDFNGHTTNFTNNTFTGARLTTTFPSTPGDTPPGTPPGVVTYTYGSASCADPNNKDPNNPYYVCTATDEGGHTTTYMRDTSKRVTQINYPDGGTESFQYNSFGQVTSHTLPTSGTETLAYDSRGLQQTYRDAFHATGNPNLWYQYDSLDRISGTTSTLGTGPGDVNHTTNYTFNSRGDITVTTLPVDPVDGQRHTITKGYNTANGTVTSITDQLGHTASFVYDDYKRLKSTTTPGHNTPLTASVCYGPAAPTPTPSPPGGGCRVNCPPPTPTPTPPPPPPPSCGGDDYTHTDATVTIATSAGGKETTIQYDENRRKISVTVAPGTNDAATITFAYDLNGNLTSVVTPKEQPGQQFTGQSTTTVYDERDRPYSVTDSLGNVTSCTYDAAGHKKSVTRANGQVATFDSFDPMNRLLQSTVKQTPDPDAVTKYTYYTSGLLHTMQDPHLVANNSGYSYSYQYDSMGRKTSLTYPPDSLSVQRTESWHYDTAGRIDTFTNRNGNTQRTIYDSLSRRINVAWDDSGLTPTVTLGYDVASRVISINNANANISHAYFNDGLLNSEATTYADNTPRTVTYYYDADGNRAGDATHPGIQYPNAAYAFSFAYTGRNQLSDVTNFTSGANVAHFIYDLDGNLNSQTRDNSTSSSYSYDGLDRLTHIGHALNGTTRTFDYAYDSVSNRKWVKRDGGTGDVFGYDLADQSTSILMNVANPDTTSPGTQTINYDANGNRTTFSPYGSTDTYTANNLNQYIQRNTATASYDTKGNMLGGFDGSAYTYDAQSRILTASKSGTTDTFKYDALNRQVSRQVGSAPVVYNIYDGWNLIAEYAAGSSSPSTAYLGAIKNLAANLYYYQDVSGSTSHLAGSTGALLEWYRYDLQGAPIFYNALNTQLSTSNYSVRHLFTSQQWYSELGLYDLRNRFYSPDTGRFLQGDPLSFGGGDANLYRYGANSPLSLGDPFGLWTAQLGFSFTANIGPGVFSFGAGFVFDGHGNVSVYGTDLIGAGGLGASIGLGLGGMGSNADTIYGLQGTFAEGGVQVGDEGAGSAVSFYGRDAVNGQRVVGGGGFLGAGGGASWYGGASNTSVAKGINIFSLFSSRPSTSYDVGPDGRIIVIGASVNATSGGPSGNGYGYSFANAFHNADISGVSEDAATIGAGHVANAEINAAIEMGGWATSPGPLHGTAVGESAQAGDGGDGGPRMFWTAAPVTQYATGWRYVKDPWGGGGGSARGSWAPTGWTTDPALAVTAPTLTPSGKKLFNYGSHRKKR